MTPEQLKKKEAYHKQELHNERVSRVMTRVMGCGALAIAGVGNYAAFEGSATGLVVASVGYGVVGAAAYLDMQETRRINSLQTMVDGLQEQVAIQPTNE